MKLLLDWISGVGVLVGATVLVWLTMLIVTRDKARRFTINKRKVLLFVGGFLLVAIIPWLVGHFLVHDFLDLFHSAPPHEGPDLH